MMRRFVNEGWNRRALLSCAVLLLCFAGAASQAWAPRAISTHLDRTAVDDARPSDHGIRNGQAGLRLAADRRHDEPGFDRAPPPDIIVPTRPAITTSRDARAAWPGAAVDPSSSHRVAHRPRGPPQAAVTSSKLWNDGAALPHGSHHA
jgi:hypothetical protein